MLQEFDLCGTHVLYEKITDYNIVQREYIYRPSLFWNLLTPHF